MEIISAQQLQQDIDQAISDNHTVFRCSQATISGQLTLTISAKINVVFHEVFFENFMIDWIEPESKLRFTKCEFNEFYPLGHADILLNFCVITRLLYISDAKGQFYVRNSTIRKIEIANVSEFECFATKSEITDVSIMAVKDEISELYFYDLILNKIELAGIINSRVVFERIDGIRNLALLNFRSLASGERPNIILDKLSANQKGLFKTDASTLNEKVLIKNCDLRNLRWLMSDSDISSMNHFNVQWSSLLDSGMTGSFNEKEIFRQLKSACENNGDKISAKIFGSLELHAYFNYLKANSAKWQDRFPLQLSLLTNNFGTKWVWAFRWIFGISILFYFVISILQSYDYMSVRDFWLSGSFFNFVFPTHSIKDIVPNPDRTRFYGLIIFFDFTYKVLNGFLLFQLIRAFRFHTNLWYMINNENSWMDYSRILNHFFGLFSLDKYRESNNDIAKKIETLDYNP